MTRQEILVGAKHVNFLEVLTINWLVACKCLSTGLMIVVITHDEETRGYCGY